MLLQAFKIQFFIIVISIIIIKKNLPVREHLSIMIWQTKPENDKVKIFLCPFRLIA